MRGAAAELGDDAGDVRQDVAERRPRHPRHQDVAGRDAAQFALAIDDDRTAGAPADAGRMAAELRVLQPDIVRYVHRLHVQGPRLQQFEADLVERPFDLDRHADDVFRLAQHAPKRHGLAGAETRLAREIGRHGLRANLPAVAAGVAMVLAAGLDLPHETLAAEHDAIGHDLALRNCRAETPCGAEQHPALRGLAQAP